MGLYLRHLHQESQQQAQQDQPARPNTGIEGIVQPRDLDLLEMLDLHVPQFRLALTWVTANLVLIKAA